MLYVKMKKKQAWFTNLVTGEPSPITRCGRLKGGNEKEK